MHAGGPRFKPLKTYYLQIFYLQEVLGFWTAPLIILLNPGSEILLGTTDHG